MWEGDRRYQVRRLLGEGGMGVVYEALDRERGALVALKTLREARPDAIARFKREFRALTDVIHPNLVTLYELVSREERLFFTMELVTGVRFHDWVRPGSESAAGGAPTEPVGSGEASSTAGSASGEDDDPDESFDDARKAPTVASRRRGAEDVTGPTVRAPLGPVIRRPRRAARGALDVARLRAALRQLAEGVVAIHDAGLLHRDLKPSNVLVAPDGRVVILDFGLVAELAAENLAAATGDNRPLEGTIHFMSPEQAARLALGPASDWYSVGVMLYVCLTGHPPYAGGGDDVLMDKQLFEPPRPRSVAPDVPEDLDALCMALLARDAAARPMGAEVLRVVGSDAAPKSWRTGVSSHRSHRELVGRDELLADLARAALDSRRGPVLVHLRGASGMGKSHLVREYLARVADQGKALVLAGRCYERESVPFKAVDSVIDALARHLATLSPLEVEGLMPRDAQALARVFPVLHQLEAFSSLRRRAPEAPSPVELRRRSFAALRELLSRLADRTPLVLAVDDVHWADVDSAALLGTLLRPPEAPALQLVLAYRSEEAERSDFLIELAALLQGWTLDVRHLEVCALAPADVAAIARHYLGATRVTDSQLERLVGEAAGSPLFVEELARRLVDERNDAATGTAGAGAGERGLSLAEVLRRRLERLPPAAARLLATVAVAGQPLAQEVALRASDVRDPAHVSVLRAGSLMRGAAFSGGRWFEPYHDRVRETAVAMLSPEELKLTHLRLARAFESTPRPDPETLVFHLRGAGELDRAAGYAALGAERAAQALAFDRAARLYRLALELSPTPARAHRVALANALSHAGRGADAADAYLAAVPGAPPAEALELLGQGASHLFFSGHLARGLATIEQVFAQMDVPWPRSRAAALASFALGRARLKLRGYRWVERDAREVPPSQLTRIDVAAAVAQGLGFADPLRAVEFQPRYALLALSAGEPRRVVQALGVEAAFLSLTGVRAAARVRGVLDRVAAIAAKVNEPATHGLRLGAEGIVAFNEGRWREAFDQCLQAEQLFRDHCHGLRWEVATCQIYTLCSLVLNGRLPEFLALYPRWQAEAEERGDLYAAVSQATLVGVLPALLADDAARGHELLDAAMARWQEGAFHLQHANAMCSHVSADLYVGDAEAAWARVEAAWPAVKRSMFLRIETVHSLLVAARGKALYAVLAARGAAPTGELARLAQRLEREPVLHARVNGRVIAAGIARLRGDLAGAVRLLGESELMATQAELLLTAASIRRQRGRLLGGREGAALVAGVDEELSSQGVRVPARFVEIYVPWFGRAAVAPAPAPGAPAPAPMP